MDEQQFRRVMRIYNWSRAIIIISVLIAIIGCVIWKQ